MNIDNPGGSATLTPFSRQSSSKSASRSRGSVVTDQFKTGQGLSIQNAETILVSRSAIFAFLCAKIFRPFSAPLLIVRDPVVLLIYAIAMAEGVFPFNRFNLFVAALGAITFAASLLVFNYLGITLYGLRTNFLRLPLIFILPKLMQREDGPLDLVALLADDTTGGLPVRLTGGSLD